MVVILTHDDADGVCSAALLKARYPDARVIFTRPIALHRDLRQVEDEGMVFVCDIGINDRYREKVQATAKKMGKRLIFFDHHPLPVTKRHWDPKKAATQLVYEYVGKDLPEEMKWIAVFGCIGDWRETQFVTESYNAWDKQSIQFEATTLVMALELSQRKFKQYIVGGLSEGKFPSEIPGVMNKAVGAVKEERNIRSFVHANVEVFGKIAYVMDPPGRGFGGKAAIFARALGRRGVGLCARNLTGEMDLSIRSEKIDLSKIVPKAATEVSGSGGGHPEAAGATIPLGRLKDFIREMNRLI